jgi:hypothetical protein
MEDLFRLTAVRQGDTVSPIIDDVLSGASGFATPEHTSEDQGIPNSVQVPGV